MCFGPFNERGQAYTLVQARHLGESDSGEGPEVGGCGRLPVFCLSRLQFSGRRPDVDSLHGPSRPGHGYGGQLARLEVSVGSYVALVLVVSARHRGHHLRLLDPHLGVLLLDRGWHDREDGETRRQLGQLGWNCGGAGDVDAATHGLGGLHRVGHGGGGRGRPGGGVVLWRRAQCERLHHLGIVERTNNLWIGQGLGHLGVKEVALARVGRRGGNSELLWGQGTLLGHHVQQLVSLVPENTMASHLHI